MLTPINVDDAKKLAAKLAADITALLQKYEADTGLSIHSVPVLREQKPVKARVKIQLA